MESANLLLVCLLFSRVLFHLLFSFLFRFMTLCCRLKMPTCLFLFSIFFHVLLSLFSKALQFFY